MAYWNSNLGHQEFREHIRCWNLQHLEVLPVIRREAEQFVLPIFDNIASRLDSIRLRIDNDKVEVTHRVDACKDRIDVVANDVNQVSLTTQAKLDAQQIALNKLRAQVENIPSSIPFTMEPTLNQLKTDILQVVNLMKQQHNEEIIVLRERCQRIEDEKGTLEARFKESIASNTLRIQQALNQQRAEMLQAVDLISQRHNQKVVELTERCGQMKEEKEALVKGFQEKLAKVEKECSHQRWILSQLYQNSIDLVEPVVHPWDYLIPDEDTARNSTITQIGEGGFGKVFKIELPSAWYEKHNEGRREVFALKFLSSAFAPSDEHYEVAWKQLRNEMKITQRAASHMKHQVVECRGLLKGEFINALVKSMKAPPQHDAIGLLMVFEEGGSLDSFLYDTKRASSLLALSDKVQLLVQIARALKELHQLGIIHGDLTPSNILLSFPHGSFIPQIKLADFGVSQFRAELANRVNPSSIIASSYHSANAGFRGTYLYAAPEMLADNSSPDRAQASRKTDIYAFSLIMYEMLAGKRPFTGMIFNPTEEASVAAVVKALVNNRPSLQELEEKKIPSELIELIQHCWSKDRADRLTAVACLNRLELIWMQMSSNTFDVFVSHPWDGDLPIAFVLEAVEQLRKLYSKRVWIDVKEMGHDLNEGMEEGIQKSKVFLAFINRKYQQSVQTCMKEIQFAYEAKIPVVTVALDANPLQWASEELKEYSGIKAMRRFLNAEELRKMPWGSEDPDLPIPTEMMLMQLNHFLSDLKKLLAENGC